MATINKITLPNGDSYDIEDASAVKGVKGNSETSYRTGNVNITSDNIGAIPASVTGNTQKLSRPKYLNGLNDNTLDAKINTLRANRLAFLPADQIIIEKTTDGGATWLDAGFADSTKVGLFSETRVGVNLPLLNGVKSIQCGLRITITGMKYDVPSGTAETSKYNYWNSNYVRTTERYNQLKEMYFWVSSNTDTISVKVERATGAKSTTWYTIFDNNNYGMTGWSGNNYIRFDQGVFGGGTTQTGNHWNYRLTFFTRGPGGSTTLSGTSTTSAQTIQEIRGYGDTWWTAGNEYASNDHLYSHDYLKNATFPAKVTATSFSGSLTGNVTGNVSGSAGSVAWSGVTGKPTTLADYGITDAKIASGTITLGSDTITPLTSSSTLNAAKLIGAIPSAVTATTQASTDNSTKIATTAYVTTAIANLPEPMIFKGSVGTGGTVTSLPTATASNEGWTYKVITALSSPAAKVGDTVISNGSSWIVIPSGDEPSGTVTNITAGTGLSIGTTTGGSLTTTGTINHTNSVTAQTIQAVYPIKIDAQGHISAYGSAQTILSLGTGSSNAFRGDYGNSAYAHAVTNKGSAFSSGLYKITTNSEGHVTAATAVAKADITGLGIPAQDTTYTFDGTYNASTNKAATVSTVANALIDTGLTGTTTAESLLSDEVVAGSLIVNGDARFVNTINGDISGTAATATKAVQDGNGSTISSTYMKLSGTNTNSATNTFSGSNTFSNKAFYYTGIENGTTDAARVVWFADASYKGKPVYNESFKYNPSTNVLTVGSITGSAASATTATTATKLGSSNVGAADRPIYLNAGTATQTTYRMAGTNAVATTAVAITDNLNTGIWYVNGTNSTDLFSQTDGAVLVNKYSDNWISEIYQDYRTGQIALRGKNNGTWQSWRKVLDSSNYTSWAVSLTTAQTISGVKTFSAMPIAKAGVRVSNTGNTEGCDFVYDDTTESVLMSFH